MINTGDLVKGISDEEELFQYTKITKAKVLEMRCYRMKILILECEDKTKENTELIVFVNNFEII